MTPPDERPTSALLRPSDFSLRVGENGAVDVVVLAARELLAVELVVTVDPIILEVVEITPGPLLTLDGASVGAERSLETGRARARFTRPTPASGSGAVASIRLKALRSTPGAALTIESLTLISSTGGTRTLAVGSARAVVVE
jgi:hypothetical protein